MALSSALVAETARAVRATLCGMRRAKCIEIRGPVDVVVETRVGGSANEDGSRHGIETPVELVPGVLWIGHLGQGLGEQVMDACSPKGLRYDFPCDLGASYALVRQLDRETAAADGPWDHEDLVQKAVMLSRWIRPTSWGLRYAARVRPAGPDGELQRC